MRTQSSAMSGGVPALILAPAMAVIGAATAVAQQSPPYYGPHMWDGGWWMFFGPLWMILFIAAIVAVVVLLVRWLAPTSHGGAASPAGKTPLNILQERFARGEIDKQEFEDRRRVLGA